jgi:hypothetical protein
VFTGTPRGLGQVAFEKLLAGLHIELRHSRAYHPQTCGKVERFHQTLKKRLAAHDPATTLTDLQAQLDTFTDIYNHHRPHRAIGRRTPATAFAARPKATPPAGGPAPVHYRIRRDIVNNGTVTLRHNSRLHHIGIGKAHTGRRVLLLIDDLAHPHHHRRRRTAPRTHPRPHPRLPTPRRPTRPTTPPKHETMSRDTCHRCLATSHWRRVGDSNPTEMSG